MKVYHIQSVSGESPNRAMCSLPLTGSILSAPHDAPPPAGEGVTVRLCKMCSRELDALAKFNPEKYQVKPGYFPLVRE